MTLGRVLAGLVVLVAPAVVSAHTGGHGTPKPAGAVAIAGYDVFTVAGIVLLSQPMGARHGM
jgi:hypothetical protein